MNTKKYYIYVRKSSESEDRQVLSLESQINESEELAKKNGYKVVKTFKESMSAKTPGKRSQFNQMIEELKKGKADGIICWKLDRLARNAIEGGQVIDISYRGIEIQTPSQSFMPDDDKIIMYIEFGMANKYVDDLSKNVIRGNKTKYGLGHWCGPAPFGYLNDKSTKYIIKDSKRFDLLRKLWEFALTGMYSLNDLVKKAEEVGLTTKPQRQFIEKTPSKSQLHRVFKNPFYYGMMLTKRYGLMPGNHTPMITEDEFNQVQRLFGGRNNRPLKTTTNLPYRNGLIKCKECGCSITAQYSRPRPGEEHIYYRCTKQKGPCSQKYIHMHELEAQIEEILSEIEIHDDFANWALIELRKRHDHEVFDRQKITTHHQNALNRTQRDLDGLLKIKIRNLIDDNEYTTQKRILLEQQAVHKEYIEDGDNRAKKWLATAEKAITFARNVKRSFLIGDWNTKHEILTAIGSNMVLHNKKLSLELSKAFSLFAKTADKSMWFPD